MAHGTRVHVRVSFDIPVSVVTVNFNSRQLSATSTPYVREFWISGDSTYCACADLRLHKWAPFWTAEVGEEHVHINADHVISLEEIIP